MEKSSYQKLRKKLKEVQKWIWIQEVQAEELNGNSQAIAYVMKMLKELQNIIDEKNND